MKIKSPTKGYYKELAAGLKHLEWEHALFTGDSQNETAKGRKDSAMKSTGRVSSLVN
jgi:hypothetical protein